MGSCLVTRNNKGLITEVKTPQGEASQLFNELHSIPFLADAESTLSIFSNSYAQSVQTLFAGATKNVYSNGEPRVFFKSSIGTEYNDIDDLLIEGDLGRMELGFKNPNTDEFIPIASLDLDGSEKNKFLVDSIQQGLLSPKRVLGPDGQTRFQGEGQYNETKKASAWGVKFDLMCDLGIGNTKVNAEGLIEINFARDYVVGLNADSAGVIKITDIPKQASNFDNATSLLVTHTITENNPRPLITNAARTEKPVSDIALRQQLLNFLANMGFELSTLREYQKNYTNRHGEDANVNALIDLSNKVVAISEGGDMTAELVEEVAHLAIEAYAEQNSIVGALANVHLTPEWSQFSKQYYETYGKNLSGQALEDQVRKEILGKVLAKSIVENFSEDNKTSEQLDLLGRIKSIWDKFKAFVGTRLTKYNKTTIDELNKTIARNILYSNMESFNKDAAFAGYYYQLKDSESKDISATLKASRDILINTYRETLNSAAPNQTELDNIVDDMNETEVLTSINAIIDVTDRLLNQVNHSVKTVEKDTSGKTKLSTQDSNIFYAVKDNTIPILENLRDKLGKADLSDTVVKEKQRILSKLDEVIQLSSTLRPKVESDLSAYAKAIFDQTLATSSLTETQKEEMWYDIQNNTADNNFMTQYFGLASTNSNAMIRLISHHVAVMSHNINVETKQTLDPSIAYIDQEGLLQHQKNIIKRDEKGKGTSYYLGFINWAKYDRDIKDLTIELLVKVSGKTKQEVERMLKDKVSKKTIVGGSDNLREFNTLFSEETEARGLHERPRTQEYYDQEKKKYTDIDAHSETILTIRNMSRERASLLRKAQVVGSSRIDRTKMNEADKVVENNIKKRRKEAASAVDKSGEFKLGLGVTKIGELTEAQIAMFPQEVQAVLRDPIMKGRSLNVTVVDGYPDYNSLPTDSRVAFDFSNLGLLATKAALEKAPTGDYSDDYLNKIKDFANPAEAFAFVEANSTVGLSKKYFDAIGEGNSYERRMQDIIHRMEDNEEQRQHQIMLDELKVLQAKKASLLKQNRNSQNPLEIEGGMHASTKVALTDIENNIELLKKTLNLPFDEEQKFESIRTTNEAFEKDRTEAGKSVIDFAKKHMTEKRSANFTDFENELNNLLSPFSKVKKTKKSFERFISEQIAEKPKLTAALAVFNNETGETKAKKEARDKVKKILLEAYAERNVLSYYTRFEPKGYLEAIDGLRNGTISVKDLLDPATRDVVIANNKALEYIEITPDYSWMNDVGNEDTVNPNYEVGGIGRQPNITKYADVEGFFNHYGISHKDWADTTKGPITTDLNNFTPTKNIQEYKALKLAVELRKSSIENNNNTGQVNPFTRPGVRHSMLEKTLKLSWVESMKELVKTRDDDKAYGEQIEGEDAASLGVRLIPKFFQNTVEDPSELTDNIFTAALLDAKQAVKYKHRTRMEGDFRALEWQVANQKLVEKGGVGSKIKKTKSGATSKSLEIAQEYINHHLYGIKQTRNMTTTIFGKDIDFTKVITQVQTFTRFSNLGFNPFVDIVSATTGVINNVTDRLTEDYYHKSSAAKATSQVTGMLGAYFTDEGKMNKTSTLNHLLEYFGLEDFEGKVAHSSFSRAVRFGTESAYKLSKFANLPVGPRNLLALLNDYRYIPGKDGEPGSFVSWEEFQLRCLNTEKGRNKTSISAEFAKYTEDSLFAHMDVSSKGITYNDKFKEKFPENYKEVYEELTRRVGIKARALVQNSDGVLNEIDQVAAQRDVLMNTIMMHRGWLPILFARRFRKNQWNFSMSREEEGHYTTLIKLIPSIIKGRKSLQSAMGELTLQQSKNVKRAAIESGIFVGLFLLISAMAGADDEDDSYLENMAQYIALRTFAEYSTQQIQSIPATVVDVAKNPLVPIRTIEALEPVDLIRDIVTLDVESLDKKVTKNTILKRKAQLTDLNKQISAYSHFNESVLYNVWSKK